MIEEEKRLYREGYFQGWNNGWNEGWKSGEVYRKDLIIKRDFLQKVRNELNLLFVKEEEENGEYNDKN